MRYIGWLVAGFALYRLSDVIEGMGDAAPFVADGGVAGERLGYHLTALVVLLAGGACVIRAGFLIWKSLKGGGASKPPEGKLADVEAEPEFDADAALARYLESRGSPPLEPVAPRPGGFGRKGL